MYAKKGKSAIFPAPKTLQVGDAVIYNPTDEQYSAAGYKPVTFTEPPEAPEGYYYASGWEEQNDAIVQTWTLTPRPDDIDEIEAYNIIFGGAE